MAKISFMGTNGYLVVKLKLTGSHDKSIMGYKCIPTRWAKNMLSDNYSIIRYPEEDNDIIKLMVKNKEPSNKTWPSRYALIIFGTDSYDEAMEFIDKSNVLTTAVESPDNNMNKTNASKNLSTQVKRKVENDDKNTKYDNELPKKKRKSAIRSENNFKKLIQTGQVTHQHKLSPKKISSLQKDGRYENLNPLINAYGAKSQRNTENHDANLGDMYDSGDEFESKPERIYNRPNTIVITKPPEQSRTSISDNLDTDSTQMSIVNNTAELIESRVTQNLLNPDLSRLDNLIQNLSPTNGTENLSKKDVEKLSNLHNAILDIKSNLNGVYTRNSKALKTTFESVELFVPELKQGLVMPTMQELIEKSRTIKEGLEPSP